MAVVVTRYAALSKGAFRFGSVAGPSELLVNQSGIAPIAFEPFENGTSVGPEAPFVSGRIETTWVAPATV